MKRILLADDEESILLAYKKLLEDCDVQVEAVDCAQTAQTLLDQNNFDAFIVDLRLVGSAQGMDGLMLVDYARRKNPSCFIVIITAYFDKEIEYKAYDSGADLLLEKPVSPTQLKELFRSKNIYSKTRL